uniref:Mannitol 1-phosphate dehydrogenase n=1 Tax=Ganoderma boninense TaxID=34458 RepID=A0A5K1JVD5_9APHY|nr:Mannitol 1-phosphate dehydrogenase [Ganoderma boninense]
MWEIIEYLGLGDELRQVSGGNNPTAQPVNFRKADEAEPVDFSQLPPTSKHLSPDIPIHFSKRLVSYAEPTKPEAPIVLQFRNGTSAECDVLVGSDGIRSAVRRSMFNTLADEARIRGDMEDSARLRSMVDPVWSGQIAHRGLISTAALRSSGLESPCSPVFLLGKNKHIVQYPINRGELLNMAAFIDHPGREDSVYDGPWVSSTTGDKVKEHFAEWSPEVPPIIEDGFILAAIIAQPTITAQNIPAALDIYDTLRRPVAEMVLRRSRKTGLLYHFNTLGWEDVTAKQSAAGGFSPQRLEEVGKALREQFDWLLTSSVMELRERAIDMACGLKQE